MAPTTIGIYRLENAKDLDFPTRATVESIGYDIRANIQESVTVAPNSSALIPCGFKLNLPSNIYAEIRSRSGLTLKSSVLVFHGLIDSDYSGEVCVVLLNLNRNESFTVNRGDRIAQIVFHESASVRLVEEKQQISTTHRGNKGFGSSGLK